MNKDHDYQKMITGILNLNTSDIETINVYEEANNPVIYVTLKRKKESVCPYCSSQMYRLNGFYARKIIVDNDFIVN